MPRRKEHPLACLRTEKRLFPLRSTYAQVVCVFKEIQVQPEKVFEMLFSPASKDLQI